MKSNRIKLLREEKGLLQSDIANVINKSTRIVSFYEKGERDMGTETLSKLASFFNVSIDYLLGNSDIRNTNEIQLTAEEIEFAKKVKPLSKQNKELLQNMIETLKKNND